MITEKIKIHGDSSFELDLGYSYKKNEKRSDYDIETYIFVPRSLDVNSSTYSQTDFFQDLKTNIRFTTPLYNFNDILYGNESAYAKLVGSISNYTVISNSENAKQFRYHVKMFVSIYRSSLTKALSKAFNLKSDEEIGRELLGVIEELKRILSKYRLLDKGIENKFDLRERNVYRFGDEFLSYSTERYLLQLIKKLSRNKYKHFEIELLRAKIELKRELDYQKTQGFIQMETKEGKTNENTVYRRGILRKFAEDRLFLNARTQKDGKIIEQIIFSLAAGIAMVFATVIAFLSQMVYGNFTTPLFIALVVSYMAKDRIKELIRNNVNDRIQSKYLFFHRTKIVSGEEKLGYCKESFQFVPEKKLPSTVAKIRNRNHLTDIENDWKGEDIMYYRKRVEVYNRRFHKVLKEYEISGIKDIVRFNLSNFTTKMSSPYLFFNAYDTETDEVVRVKSEKVYHLNMIVLMKYQDRQDIKRYRIFLNKNGLKRIEKVKNRDK
jgi:hypothetical protein